MQPSCSKEGNRVYLSLFPLEKFKEGKKPASIDDTHLFPTRAPKMVTPSCNINMCSFHD